MKSEKVISYKTWHNFIDYALKFNNDRIEVIENMTRDLKLNLGYGDYLIFTNLGIVYVFIQGQQNILCYNRTIKQLKILLSSLVEK